MLGSNKFQGTLPHDLFSRLTNLKYLHVNNNDFSGSLPTEVGLLSSLMSLELQNSNLSGSLPSELLLLENMTSLVVRNTSFSGSIPESLCDRMYEKELNCLVAPKCKLVGKKTNSTVCHQTDLCGCDCGPLPMADSQGLHTS